MEKVLEGMEENVYSKCNIDFNQDREEECRCRELKIICKESEEKCATLEAEIQKSRKQNEALERKIKLMETEKLSLEEELKVLRDKNWQCGQEKRPVIIDLTEESEEDKIVQILIENKVLECEKKKAEDDAKVWKARFKELESSFLNFDKMTRNRKVRREQPLDMEGRISTGFSPGTPPSTTLLIDRVAFGREKISERLQSQVRRQLDFKEETSQSKRITLSTPGSARPIFLGSVCATDNDDEPNINELSCRKVSLSTTRKSVNEVERFEDVNSEQENGENGDASNQNLTFISTPKRKRFSRIVKSDTESDCEDDDIPISKLKRLHLCNTDSDQVSSQLNGRSQHPTTRKHRLRKASTEKEHVGGVSTNEGVEDDDLEEVGSESEGESLDGFIVECSDASSDGDKDSNTEHSLEDFDKILSKIRRKNDKKFEWEFEADMLADFGKDPELCMKAVCALYRQQTSEEKICRSTIYSNKQGFSQFDDFRGSIIAEFLTGGDWHSDVVKSVDELREYNAEAVELCRNLATHYSKQLFKIYKEKVDPLFLPPPPSS